MNIAFLVYEYAHKKTPHYGGIGTYFKVIANELVKRGHKVYVFHYNPYIINNIEQFYDGEVEIVNLKNFFRNHFFYRKLKKVARKIQSSSLYTKMIIKEHKYIAENFLKFIQDKNIDIIKTHDNQGFFSFLRTDIPKVIHCHGSTMMLVHSFGYKLDKLSYDSMRFLEQKSFDNADYIMAVSEFSARTSQKLFKSKEINVINNGIDISKFFANENKEEIPFSIFYFGAVRQTKGVDIVAKVFNKVIEKEERATLHVIGNGEEYWNYLNQEVLSDKAKKNSIYYGQVIRDEIVDKLKRGSVFIFPSQGENFPFTFIEAMALEKVVVVSNIEVSKEIINDGVDGFIAKSEDEYTQIILDLFKDEERRKKIAIKAKEKVVNKYTIEKMVDDTITLYKGIVK